MNTNNSSGDNRLQNLEQDANERASESTDVNDANNKNRMQQSSEMSAAGNTGDYRSNKGTGMSSEAGSGQSERAWQDTGGGHPATNNRQDTEENGGDGKVKQGITDQHQVSTSGTTNAGMRAGDNNGNNKQSNAVKQSNSDT